MKSRRKDDQPAAPEQVLATFAVGAFDTALEPPATLEAGDAPLLTAADDALVLPRGGWLALRKSGGLRFTSRESVVYRDGRLVTKSGAGRQPTTTTRQLTAAELTALQATVAGISFGRLRIGPGRQSPDGFAYELVIRPRRRYTFTFFDANVPTVLRPLLDRLSALLLD